MSFAEALFRQLDIVGNVRAGQPQTLSSNPADRFGARERVAYMLNRRTGTTPELLGRIAGVPTATVRRWARGDVPNTQRPAVDRAYRRLLALNNQARAEARRPATARAVILAVAMTALKLTNNEGDIRYWKPRANHWPRFIARWARNDIAGANADWNVIVSDWDYPEPWEADAIEDVDIT